MDTKQEDEDHEEEREKRTTAFGMWRYALEYLTAARALANAEAERGQSGLHWDATYQCACHGLELVFKAYVRAGGANLDKPRKLGHSIEKSMKCALSRGMPALSPDHVAAIQVVEPLYRSHEFRYIVTGIKTYPKLSTLLEAGEAALLATASAIADATTSGDNLTSRMRHEVEKLRSMTAKP